MNAGIFGPYKEHSEVMKQVKRLKEQGYKESELIIVADSEERILEEKKANLQFKTLEEQHDFFDTMRAALLIKTTEEEYLEEVEKLLDVTDEEAEVYYEQLKAGNIFIFIRPENMLIFDDVSNLELVDENFEGDPITRVHTDGL